AGVVHRHDVDHALALLAFAQTHLAGDLCHDGRLARPPSLEDFRDARQTAGDVLRTADLPRRLRQQRAREDLVALAHLQVRLFGDIVALQLVAALTLDDDLRVQVALVLGDHPAFGPRTDVALLTERFALHNLLETYAAAALGEDRRQVRIDLEEDLIL